MLRGVPVSKGIVVAEALVLDAEDRRTDPIQRLASTVIVLARNLTYEQAAEFPADCVLGLATDLGSEISQVADVAKSLRIPAVVGLGSIDATDGDLVILDGTTGKVIIDPDEVTLLRYRQRTK